MNVPILMYHNITDNKKDNSSLYYKDFEKQIKYLSKLKYKSYCLKSINEENYKKKIVITFDDGYENVSKICQEILDKFKYNATCFIVANNIDKKNTWDKNNHIFSEKKLMNDDQISNWINHGNEIGSHTFDHLDLTSLNLEEKKFQIIKSNEFLEKRYNQKIDTFAYPYGKYDDNCFELLSINYKYAVTTDKSLYNPLKHSNFKIPRVSIGNKISLFKFFLKILTQYENLKI